MSNADRIEELRTKYEENPRRYFAPLANEFRKAGDLAQAIAICREHLPKQPGHMSGYIVFGQTLFEANSLEEARTVFEQALALDPENLIALKHLGDIARMNGENSVARRWYARVLDADPRNDDIASQLASLGAPTPAIPVAAIAQSPAPVAAPVFEEAPGVFNSFDPSSLLDVPDDVVGAHGNSTLNHADAFPTDDVASGDAVAAEAVSADVAPVAAASTLEHAEVPEYTDTAESEERAVAEARFEARHEPLDLDFPDDPEPPADEEFEEGILAPQWPDTTELVARIVTPVRSATPLSVPATVEAVAAFGREASDPSEATLTDAPVSDELVDAFLPADHLAPSTSSAPERELESEFLAGTDETPEAETSSTSFIAELEAAEFEPAEFDASTFETVDFEAPQAEVEHEIPVTAQLQEEPLISLSDAPMAWELAQQASPQESEPSAVGTVADEEAASVEPQVEFDVTAEYAVPHDDDFEAANETPLEFASEFGSQPTAELPIFELPEESYAEMSSEIENERVEEQVAAQEASERVAPEAPGAAAETVPVAATEESEKAPTFVTETMAELLVSQGFVSRAIEVYDELVRRRPHDPVLVARLEELRTTESDALKRADELIAQQTSFETPALATPIVTPLYSTPLRATPVFTPHASTSGQFSAQVNAQQAFRTARERFAELASRRVARRTPTHATAVADDQSDGLSTLFGTSQPTTTDELAARALADAFGPVQDSGESLFDPAPLPTPTVPLRALTPRHTTPIHTPAQANPDHRSDRQPASDYSFDKFFPDPAMTNRDAQTVHSAAAATPDTSQPVNEDLAQFSAWLKGLNNA